MRLIAATLALLLLALAPQARADWCIDLAAGQNYDCAQTPPSQARQQAPQARTAQPLHKLIKTSTPAQNAYAEQLQQASQRAQQALTSASLTNDPAERAQFNKAYQAAMQDMQSSAKGLIASTNDPALKKQLSDSLLAAGNGYNAQASQVGLQSVQTQQQAVRDSVNKPTGDVFSVCEQPKAGVTTCYEIGRTGSQCREVWYQGGLRTLERGMTTCSAEDLKQRDAYFAGLPVGQDAPAQPLDPRSQQIAGLMASLSPQCQQDLKAYLYGARDAQSSRGAGTQALQSFSNIESNQACKAGYEQLASIMGVGIPQRRLGNSARSAWAGGMAEKPRQTVNVPDVHDMPQGYYGDNSGGGGFDAGEVLDAGAQLLGVLGAVLGGFAEGYGGGYGGGAVYSSRPVQSYGGPTGSGYVYRGNSGGSQSTITGTRR